MYMAEFCLDCWVEELETNTKKRYVLSKHLDLCEGCGQYKHVVIREKIPFFYVRRTYRRIGNFLRRKIR